MSNKIFEEMMDYIFAEYSKLTNPPCNLDELNKNTILTEKFKFIINDLKNGPEILWYLSLSFSHKTPYMAEMFGRINVPTIIREKVHQKLLFDFKETCQHMSY